MVRDGLWHLVEMLGCSLCLRGVDDMTYGEKGGLGPLKMTKVATAGSLGGKLLEGAPRSLLRKN